VLLERLRSARAALLGRYPTRPAAAMMRSRVTGLTLGWPLRAREAVDTDTPHSRADLNAKLAGEPAYATIARAHGRPVPHDQGVPTYAAGGYYCDADTVDEQRALLVSELKRYRAAGYTSFKIKVGGAPMEVDLARVEAAVEIAGDAANVAVDANGRFAVEDGVRWAEALAPYGLRWLEEPCDRWTSRPCALSPRHSGARSRRERTSSPARTW
jgi:L-alanine-DL-glutamate epimerase-like enolase superfamily enzyme